MMTIRLALFEDAVTAPLTWAAAPRAIFVRTGAVTVTPDGEKPCRLEEARCELFTGPLHIQGQGVLWTFELGGRPSADLDAVDQARCILSHDIDLPADEPLVLRADRVEFPPGMETPRHGHKASGIRRLYRGRLVAEIGAEMRRIDEGDAWFESGHDPVIGRNVAPSSAFVRTMVLPAALHGQPTFIPWSDTEAAKPRGTLRTEYFDTLIPSLKPGA